MALVLLDAMFRVDARPHNSKTSSRQTASDKYNSIVDSAVESATAGLKKPSVKPKAKVQEGQTNRKTYTQQKKDAERKRRHKL